MGIEQFNIRVFRSYMYSIMQVLQLAMLSLKTVDTFRIPSNQRKKKNISNWHIQPSHPVARLTSTFQKYPQLPPFAAKTGFPAAVVVVVHHVDQILRSSWPRPFWKKLPCPSWGWKCRKTTFGEPRSRLQLKCMPRRNGPKSMGVHWLGLCIYPENNWS